jgi:hypothetical protein
VKTYLVEACRERVHCELCDPVVALVVGAEVENAVATRDGAERHQHFDLLDLVKRDSLNSLREHERSAVEVDR